jgi:hypothetical protein
MLLEVFGVTLFRAEKKGDAIVRAGYDKSVSRGPKALYSVAAQPVPDEDCVVLVLPIHRVNLSLKRLAQLIGVIMKTLSQKTQVYHVLRQRGIITELPMEYLACNQGQSHAATPLPAFTCAVF